MNSELGLEAFDAIRASSDKDEWSAFLGELRSSGSASIVHNLDRAVCSWRMKSRVFVHYPMELWLRFLDKLRDGEIVAIDLISGVALPKRIWWVRDIAICWCKSQTTIAGVTYNVRFFERAVADLWIMHAEAGAMGEAHWKSSDLAPLELNEEGGTQRLVHLRLVAGVKDRQFKSDDGAPTIAAQIHPLIGGDARCALGTVVTYLYRDDYFKSWNMGSKP